MAIGKNKDCIIRKEGRYLVLAKALIAGKTGQEGWRCSTKKSTSGPSRTSHGRSAMTRV